MKADSVSTVPPLRVVSIKMGYHLGKPFGWLSSVLLRFGGEVGTGHQMEHKTPVNKDLSNL